MNTAEKILYKIGDFFTPDEPEFDDVDEYVITHSNERFDYGFVFNTNALKAEGLHTIINTIQKTGIEVCNFGVHECKIGNVYNLKVLYDLRKRENHTLVVVKVRNKGINNGMRKIHSRYIFYTVGYDNQPLKISIETYCTFYADDASLDEIAMDINGLTTKMIIDTSNVQSITYHKLVVPINEVAGYSNDKNPTKDDLNSRIDVINCDKNPRCCNQMNKVVSIKDCVRHLQKRGK